MRRKRRACAALPKLSRSGIFTWPLLVVDCLLCFVSEEVQVKKLIAAILICAFAPFVFADNDEATQVIAGVLVDFNHFPSDDAKVALQALVDDDSVGPAFKAVATAVMGIEHSASDDGKAALAGVLEAENADPRAKSLAEVVMGLTHGASDDAKASLQAML